MRRTPSSLCAWIPCCLSIGFALLFCKAGAQIVHVTVKFPQSVYSVNETGVLTVRLVASELDQITFDGEVIVTCQAYPNDSRLLDSLPTATLLTSQNAIGADYTVINPSMLLSGLPYEDRFNVTFTEGNIMSSPFEIQIVGDNVYEGTEYFQLMIIGITLPSGFTGATFDYVGAPSLVSILDDDVLLVRLTEPSVTVSEGQTVSIGGEIAPSSSPFASPVMIGVICYPQIATLINSAIFPDDYIYTPPLTLEFADINVPPPVLSSTKAEISCLSDGIVEGTEAFICALQVGVSEADTIRSTHPDTITITCLDRDELCVKWSEPVYSVLEGAGTVTVELLVCGRYAIDFILQGSSRVAMRDEVGGQTFTRAVATTSSIKGDFRITSTTFSYRSSVLNNVTGSSALLFIEDDRILEEDEIFEVTFNIPTLLAMQINIVPCTPVVATIIIRDDDQVSVGFANTSCIGSEEERMASFNLQIDGKYYLDFQVEVECRSGSAVAGEDFVMFRKFFNISRPNIQPDQAFEEDFPNTTVSPPFVIDIIDDSILERVECFICEIVATSHPGVQIGTEKTISCCVTDEDAVTVQFSKANDSANESGGPLQFEVELIGSTSFDIIVEVQTVNLLHPSIGPQATAGLDYMVSMTQLTFPPTSGRGTQPFRVGLIPDLIPEGAEYFSVVINRIVTSHSRVMIGVPSSGVGEILDDDPIIMIGFSASTYDVVESAMKVEVCVSLSSDYFEDITVTVTPTLITGGALDVASSNDFISSPLTITIGSGATQACEVISIVDDSLVELTERFHVILSYTGGQKGVVLNSNSTSTVNILNDDSLQLRFEMRTYSGREGSIVQVKVLASNVASFDYNFTVSSVDRSASAPMDYNPVQLTFDYISGSNVTEFLFNVSINNDGIFEGNEHFELHLDIPGVFVSRGVGQGDPNVTMVTILEDEVVCVYFDPINYTVSEGEEVAIVIVTNVSVSVPITVTVNLGGGSADSQDYDGGTLDVVIQPGTHRATLNITALADSILERTENFFAILSIPSGTRGVVICDQSIATVTIIDQTTTSVVFLQDSASAVEGGPAFLVLRLTGGVSVGPNVVLTVNIALRNGTATGTLDFNSATIPVNFVGGSNAASFVIPTIDDSLVEGVENLFADIVLPPAARDLGVTIGSPGTATVNINDNDDTTVFLSSDQFVVDERGEICIGIQATRPSNIPYSVEVNVIDGTAKRGRDFGPVAVPIPVNFNSLELDSSACIPIMTDSILEGNEEFTVTLVIPQAAADIGVVRGNPHMATITILDDDTIKVTLSTDKVTVPEGTSQTISVSVDGEFAIPFNVSVNAIPGSAGPSDFNGSIPTITFNPNETSVDVILTAISDNIPECDETFTVVLSIPPSSRALNVTLGDISSATVVIEDRGGQSVSVSFQPVQYFVTEGNKTTVTLVTNSSAYSFPFTVSLMFMDDTATSGSDYVPMPVSVTFSPGQQELSFEVMATVDQLTESSELFKIITTDILVPPTCRGDLVVLGTDTAYVNIADSNELIVSLKPLISRTNEGSTVNVTIETNIPHAIEFDVILNIMNGTAFSDVDFTPGGSRTIVLLASPTEPSTLTVTFDIRGDNVVEGEEFFTLSLSPSQFSIGRVSDDVAMVNIVDQTEVELGVPPNPGVVEGDVVRIMVMILNDVVIATPFNITVSTRNGSAGASTDYLPLGPITYTFHPGSKKLTINISTVDDDRVEARENFTVHISPSGPDDVMVTMENHTISVVIIDDDDFTFRFAQSTYTVNENGGFVDITVVTDMTTVMPFPFMITVMDGTATVNMDYRVSLTPLAGSNDTFTAMFPGGTNTFTFRVQIINDSVLEGRENFTLKLDVETIVRLREGIRLVDPKTTTITILDDETAPVIEVVDEIRVPEGQGYVEVCLQRTDNSSQPVLVMVIPQEIDPDSASGLADTAKDGQVDFDENSGPDVIRFELGETMKCFNVTITDDNVTETDEDFEIEIVVVPDGPSGGGTSPQVGPVTVTIVDDDEVKVNFLQPTYNVSESHGRLTVTLISTGTSAIDYDVRVTARGVTAQGMIDFRFIPTTVTFEPGQTMKDVTVEILEDMILEGVETFILDLTVVNPTPSSVSEGDIASTEVTIYDNDDILVNFDPDVYIVREGDNVTVTLVTSMPHIMDYTVTITTQGNTAKAPADFTGGPYVITIPSGTTMVNFTIVTIADNVVEMSEDFELKIVNTSNNRVSAGVDDIATVTIQDTDVAIINFNPTTYTVAEGTVVTVIAVSDKDFEKRTTIMFMTVNGTAIDGQDFAGGVFTLTFTPGSRSATAVIRVFNDSSLEGLEEFTVVLKDPGDPSLTIGADDTATITITDDLKLSVFFSDEIYFVNESDPNGLVTVETSGPHGTTFLVTVAISSGNATAFLDFNAISMDITFQPGETVRSIQIPIINDVIIEGTECAMLTLFVSQAALTNGILPGTPQVASLCIIDDDVPKVSFKEPSYRVNEGGSVTIGLQLDRPPTTSVTVTVATMNGTAFDGEDFEGGSFSVFFPLGATMATLIIPTTANPAVEGTEQFKVMIVDPGTAMIGNPSIAVINITEEGLRFVNDTIIGDPLFTIPLPNVPAVEFPELQGVSLCMEFHGLANKYYNLVSDGCTNVNAHYTPGVANPDLHIIDEIGVKAEGSGGACHEVRVQLAGCRTFVDGTEVTGMYRSDGVMVFAMPSRNRTRITVPNCSTNKELVMWVTCERIGREPNLDDTLHFTLSRALGLEPTSHGLVAQFWNIPIEYMRFTGLYGDEQVTTADGVYAVTVRYPGSPARTFLAELSRYIWSGEMEPCLYAGNRLAGRSYEGRHFGSVIEGRHRDYEVSSVFAHEFTFDKYDSTC